METLRGTFWIVLYKTSATEKYRKYPCHVLYELFFVWFLVHGSSYSSHCKIVLFALSLFSTLLLVHFFYILLFSLHIYQAQELKTPAAVLVNSTTHCGMFPFFCLGPTGPMETICFFLQVYRILSNIFDHSHSNETGCSFYILEECI